MASFTAIEPLAGSFTGPPTTTCCTPLTKRLKLYVKVVPGVPAIVPLNWSVTGQTPE